MKNNPKFYFILLLISTITFIGEVFILKLSGALGLSICIISLYFLIGSIIRLLRLTGMFNDEIMEKIDILFL